MILTKVLLPAPFSPSSAWIWLCSTVRETWSLARQPGYCFVMPVIRSSGPAGVGSRAVESFIPAPYRHGAARDAFAVLGFGPRIGGAKPDVNSRRGCPAYRRAWVTRGLAEFPVNALNQPLHSVQRAIVHRGPGRDFDRAGLIHDRPNEHFVLARRDIRDRRRCLSRDIRRHVGEWRHRQHAAVETTPGVGAFPGTVHHVANPLDVVRSPNIRAGGQLSGRREFRHIGGLAERFDPSAGGGLQRGR